MRKICRDSIPHLVSVLFDRGRCLYCNILMSIKMRWWRVNIGRCYKFFGLCLIRRVPNSVIEIGSNACFRSAEWANLAGISHKCFLSTLSEGAELVIGDNCGFSGAILSSAVSIRIGDSVVVGANSVITDTDWHPLSVESRNNKGAGLAKPIVIEDNVWLGMNVLVLKGVSIGEGAVVAANSVVVNSIPPNVLVAGVPAKFVRYIN